jgi:hypothetical protein
MNTADKIFVNFASRLLATGDLLVGILVASVENASHLIYFKAAIDIK